MVNSSNRIDDRGELVDRIDDRDVLVEPPPPFLRALFFGDFGPHRPVDCRLRFPTHEVELVPTTWTSRGLVPLKTSFASGLILKSVTITSFI